MPGGCPGDTRGMPGGCPGMPGDAPGRPGAGGGPGGGRGHFPINSEDVPKVSDNIYPPKSGRSCSPGATLRL